MNDKYKVRRMFFSWFPLSFSKTTQIEPIKRCLNENLLGRKRLPSRFVFYYCSPDHSNNVVLSFAFAFDKVEGEQYDFALTFPYSYSRLTHFVSSWLEFQLFQRFFLFSVWQMSSIWRAYCQKNQVCQVWTICKKYCKSKLNITF